MKRLTLCDFENAMASFERQHPELATAARTLEARFPARDQYGIGNYYPRKQGFDRREDICLHVEGGATHALCRYSCRMANAAYIADRMRCVFCGRDGLAT